MSWSSMLSIRSRNSSSFAPRASSLARCVRNLSRLGVELAFQASEGTVHEQKLSIPFRNLSGADDAIEPSIGETSPRYQFLPNSPSRDTVPVSMSGILICKYLWIGFYVVWLLWAVWIKPAEKRESTASHFAHGVLAAAGFFLMFADVPARWLRIYLLPSGPWMQSLGIAITVAGMGVAIWARRYLGRNWSSSVTAKVGHELIRSGPYRWVRHPIYSGLLLSVFGTALVRHQVCGFVALVLIFIAWKLKRSVEERMMISTFGSQYLDYVRTTGAILPRIR